MSSPLHHGRGEGEAEAGVGPGEELEADHGGVEGGGGGGQGRVQDQVQAEDPLLRQHLDDLCLDYHSLYISVTYNCIANIFSDLINNVCSFKEEALGGD